MQKELDYKRKLQMYKEKFMEKWGTEIRYNSEIKIGLNLKILW